MPHRRRGESRARSSDRRRSGRDCPPSLRGSVPSSASATRSSSAVALTICPGVQKPHWRASSATNASCTAAARPVRDALDRHDLVASARRRLNRRHELTGSAVDAARRRRRRRPRRTPALSRAAPGRRAELRAACGRAAPRQVRLAVDLDCDASLLLGLQAAAYARQAGQDRRVRRAALILVSRTDDLLAAGCGGSNERRRRDDHGGKRPRRRRPTAYLGRDGRS